MAFPVVESVTTNGATGGAAVTGSTAANSHSLTYPATVTAGALLMFVGRVAGAGTVAITGGGWTITQDSSDGSDDVAFWMYRDTVADGTEDGTTITCTHGATLRMCAGALSITGAASPAVQAPQSSTVAIGTGTAVGPTAATPTGGAKDYLWIALGGGGGEHTSPPTTIPVNYGSSSGWSTGTAGAVGLNCTTFIATRNLNAASEDPGTWTTSVAVDLGWTAWTIAVHPAPPAAAVPPATRVARYGW